MSTEGVGSVEETISKTEAVTARPGVVRRLRLRIAAVLASVAFFVVGSAVSASAAPMTPPADPTGGAASDFLDSLTGWVTTYGVPLVFGLLLLGVSIAVGIKYAKRGAKSV